MHLTKIRGSKSKKLKDKKIVLGVTGSISAIESVKLARELIRRGAEVIAVMSESARKIIHPNALEFATDNEVITELTGKIEHVELLGNDIADLFLIAPATANTISKIAHGIDDTPVTTMATTALGSGKPVIVVPAMHGAMINNEAVRESIEILKNMGVEFVEPRYEEGKAKFPDIDKICLHVERKLYKKDLKDKRVVITSGPTFEFIDPIRFISNKSSGIMGAEIAIEMWRRGAKVKYISSKPLNSNLPDFEEIEILSVNDMLKAVMDVIDDCDIFVSAAAASDFTCDMRESKIKTSEELILKLRATPKILKEVRKSMNGKIIGFKAETGVSDELLEKIALEKMREDNLDMVVANDVLKKGMGTPDTRVLIITEKSKEWFEGLKRDAAEKIVDIFVRDCL